jgi:hypothetical protein
MRWIGRHAPRPPGHIHQPAHLPAVPVLARAVVISRMPGWQIALIAAALAAVANAHRPHWTLQQNPPAGRAHPSAEVTGMRIRRRDRLGGPDPRIRPGGLR